MNILQIPNKIEMLPVLRSFVVESAKVFKVSGDLLNHLKIVSEEAFVYILKNSFMPGEVAEVRIGVEVSRGFLELSFSDKGLPFDDSLSREYRPGGDVSGLNTEGMELFLIRKFVDRVQWINHGAEGKELRLSFALLQDDIVSILEKTGIPVKPKAPEVDINNIELRYFRDSDAIMIARSIYRAYGYTYPNEDMYYPEKIKEQNKNGQLISVVSFDTKHNEVIGHYALERPALGSIAESGQAVVAPEYRGFNLLGRMRALLEQKAVELKLEGIMSQPVTTHVFSQKVNNSFASRACGFSFGLVPQRLKFRQISESLSQRESCLLYFKPLIKRERRLYFPERHTEILKKIYRHLDLPFVVAGQNDNAAGPGRVQSNYYANWGFGVINVLQVGRDNFSGIKQALHKLLYVLKADVIFLNIVLEDAPINALVQQLEQIHFFFAGITPSLLNAKDVIRFEFLNGEINASKIHIHDNFARDLFAYILREKEKAML